MERTYTEAQWRAIAELEERAEEWTACDHERPILGWTYAGGRFCLAHRTDWLDAKFVGPLLPRFFVYEKTTQTRITFSVTSKAEALANARKRLSDCPEDHLLRIFDERRQEIARWDAMRAIALAKQEKKPRKIGKRLREIFAAANGKCTYCETKLELTGQWEVDHKMPKALGGSNERTNLVAACMPCNRRKKDKTDVEFLELLAAETTVVHAAISPQASQSAITPICSPSQT